MAISATALSRGRQKVFGGTVLCVSGYWDFLSSEGFRETEKGLRLTTDIRDMDADRRLARAFKVEQVRENTTLASVRRKVRRELSYLEESIPADHPRRRQRIRMARLKKDREPYTRQEILERDSYLCWICGGPVDLSAPYRMGNPGWEVYPHLDHVIPLSKGGSDTPANVRTAHARCNVDKGAKVVGVAV